MAEWLYGRHAVEEALRAGRRKIFRVLIADAEKENSPTSSSTHNPESIAELAARGGAKVERVPVARLDTLLRVGRHHQGVSAEASAFGYDTLADVVQLCRDAGLEPLCWCSIPCRSPELWNAPAYLGGCRCYCCVMLDRRQVEVTPAVVNASAGAVEHLHICLANNLPRAIETLKEEGLWVYALQSEADATLYTATDLRGPVGLVVGSEGRGVGRLSANDATAR